jgi:hypothetical protein
MKNRFLSASAALALLLGACGAPAAPTRSPENVRSTSLAIASTAAAETQAAIPTNTLIPTEAPTQTPTPTVEPSPTLETPTGAPTDFPSATPSGSASRTDCSKPLLSWQGTTVNFTTENETKPKGKILLLMSVLTKTGECGYLNIYGSSFSGPAGTYSAAAYVDGPKNFKVFGSFSVNAGSWKVIVRNDTIVAKGSCYPNC